MAIEKKLIHFSKLSDFETQLNAGNILDYSIVFIQDAKMIWTHGQYYDCNGGNGTSDSPTFLRIGDADDEAKANFIAVANMEKSADYYICASNVQGAPVNEIATKLYGAGSSVNPEIIGYTFYGTPNSGQYSGKLLKITTTLTINTGVITTTYESVLDAKQDTILDLEIIRRNALKGATAVQPEDIKDEVYIADFTMSSLRQGMNNGEQVRCNMNSLIEAMAANKTILVREDEEDSGYKGAYVLNGYTEDLLYFSIVDSVGNVLYCNGTSYIDIYNHIDGRTLCVQSWEDKGTYSKPSGGIPKSDLADDVQTSINRADNSLQIEIFGNMEITTLNGIAGGSTGRLYALPYESTGDEDDTLLSRTTVKTINGESIYGSGDIAVATISDVNTAIANAITNAINASY